MLNWNNPYIIQSTLNIINTPHARVILSKSHEYQYATSPYPTSPEGYPHNGSHPCRWIESVFLAGRVARPGRRSASAACCKAIFLWSSCSCVCPSRISFAFACWPRPLHSCLAPHTANNHSSNAQRPHLHDEPLSAKFGVVSANFSPIDASGELPSFNYLHSLDRLRLLVSNSLTYSPYNSMNKIGTLLHRVHAFLCFFVRVF